MNRIAKPLSLQGRLLVLVLGFAALIWVGAALLAWQEAQQEIDTLLDDHLAQAAAMLLQQTDADFDDVAQTPVLQKYTPQAAFQIFLDGQLVAHTANVDEEPLASTQEGFSTVRRADGELWRVITTHPSRLGAIVMVGERMASRQAILWAMVRGLASPALLALPLLGLALWWAVRTGLAPIRALRASLEQRPSHAAEPVVEQGLPRELQPLVNTLNGLFARIDGMVMLERRFTADAAHELRTPIAAIRAQAQVALGAGNDSAERDHALQSTLAGCDRASHLVDQLLTLARLEVTPEAQSRTAELAAVVRRVVAELAPAALSRQQEITLLAEDGCQLAASEVLLGVLVRNLIDNALRYSPEGARVQVRVHADAQGPVLEVQDSGPGMTAQAIAHLGERFFRVLGNDQPGSGLGWSIVRRLLEVFGARVQIGRSAELGGLSVAVHWSAA